MKEGVVEGEKGGENEGAWSGKGNKKERNERK